MTALAQPPTDADSLADRFEALGRFVRVAWDHVAGAEPSDVDAAQVAAAGVLSARAGNRLRLSGPGEHTVVALAGATGSGKSSLFNAIARMDLSAAGPLRPTTGVAHACVWGERDADALLDWLGVTQRFRRESALDAADEVPLHGLVLLDLPDLDSVATGHRLEADRLVGVVDLVVWVLDPQKYADRTVHEEYLRRMGPLRDVTMVVFNQVDRLTPADATRCRDDLARLVQADGLRGVPVLATSAVTGAGVDQLRRYLEQAIEGRHAAVARLEGELDEAVDGLVPLVRTGPAEAERLDDEVVDELAAEFADAAGVAAVAQESARAYERRMALPGWPFRSGRRPASERRVPPADPAAVAVALRRVAAVAGAGLPAPWPEQIQAAMTQRLDRLPDELGLSLSGARPRLPGRRGWVALRTLWWLAVVAAVVGVAWLGWYASRGTLHPPTPFGVSLGLFLLVGGVVVAAALPAVARPIARIRARRYGVRVRRRLRAEAVTMARESVEPARVVLHEYAQARAALLAAAGHPGALAER